MVLFYIPIILLKKTVCSLIRTIVNILKKCDISFNMKNLSSNLRFIHLFSRFYNLIWKIALPFLKIRPRLKQGLKQRVSGTHLTEADIWIHAASAGEAYLAVEIVSHLTPDYPMKILVSTTTMQGMEILKEEIAILRLNNISCTITWFPFDMPDIMENAVSKINPDLMVILETELWPGLLMALKRRDKNIFIVNARLSYKSYRAYFRTAFLWRMFAPDYIYAISEKDKFRFGEIFKNSEIALMSNIKFDSICSYNDFKFSNWSESTDRTQSVSFPHNFCNKTTEICHNESFYTIINNKYPMSILVSIRREEEEDTEKIIKLILKEFPRQVVGIFPRHMHRINHWKKRLTQLGFSWQLKSQIKNPLECGSIILWDVFGELKHVYPFALAAFIGGSLKPLGGQNFIESVIHGTATVTGPFTDDFTWVGEDIFKNRLVKKVKNWHEVAEFIVKNLKEPCDRYELCKKVQSYFINKRGGTDLACAKIMKIMNGY